MGSEANIHQLQTILVNFKLRELKGPKLGRRTNFWAVFGNGARAPAVTPSLAARLEHCCCYDEIAGIPAEMFSVMLALCGLATSNVEVQLPTPLPETDGRPLYSSRSDSDVTPYYVIDDTRDPHPLRINYTGKARRKRGTKSHGKGGQLRVRSKYRQRDKYSNEYWIKRTIMTKYDRNTIPANRDLSTIALYVGMSLYHILDTVITAHLSIYS